MTRGAQCATMGGTELMQVWFAGSLDSQLQVEQMILPELDS